MHHLQLPEYGEFSKYLHTLIMHHLQLPEYGEFSKYLHKSHTLGKVYIIFAAHVYLAAHAHRGLIIGCIFSVMLV